MGVGLLEDGLGGFGFTVPSWSTVGAGAISAGSGSLSGYLSGGPNGLLIGGTIAAFTGPFGLLAADSWGGENFLARMLSFSTVNGLGNVAGTEVNNALDPDPDYLKDVIQSFNIGFTASLPEAAAVAAGFDGVVSVTTGSLITAALSVPLTQIDPNSVYSLTSMFPPAKQPQQAQQPVLTTPPPPSKP